MDDKLSIRVNVADRYYPLKIDRDEEERIRKAARLINEKVLQYKKKYVDKDIQDFLAMAALQYVIQLLDINRKVDDQDVSKRIREIADRIDEVLMEKE
ncbi:MAG TPA: cell division protein ZapA [Bacteroidales bacterium]|nr:cell division protein ZapA [Bacteroidales bacterium]